MTMRAAAFACAVLCAALSAGAADVPFDRFYASASGFASVRSGGGRLRRAAGAQAVAGFCPSASVAVEGAAGALADAGFFAARAVVHWNAWSEYDELFGYERYDPFLTAGACAWSRGGKAGPLLGAGLYWHLDERWSLRFQVEASAAWRVGRERTLLFSAGLGRSF